MQWLDLVAAATEDGGKEIEDSLPVQKLAGFFRHFFRPMATGLVQLDTKVAQGQSSTLMIVGPVSGEYVVERIQYWEKIGCLKN